jgi:DNA-binding winged helix-turn-helix (wHTH) protein/predicted ATPase
MKRPSRIEVVAMKIGHLEVVTRSRQILKDGTPLRVSSSAFELLQLLLNADGAVVSTEEILSRVWPSTVVDKNNVQVHISTLRRLLGEHQHLIQTISGRGYRIARSDNAPADASGTRQDFRLPGLSGNFVGRERFLALLSELIVKPEHVIALTGLAGVGKSRLAFEAARRLANKTNIRVGYVSFAEEARQRKALSLIDAALAERPNLLLIDNGDLVLDAITKALQESASLRYQSQVVVVLTSRSPLKISMETVLDIPPLPAGPALDLFMSRTQALASGMELSSDFIERAHELIDQLDGLPLAIELAAQQTSLLGIDSVKAMLDRGIPLPSRNMRRMADSRHASLDAALAWTWSAPHATTRVVLEALMQSGMECGLAELSQLAEKSNLSTEAFLDAISTLVECSLIVRIHRGTTVTYRLPHCVRRFLRQQIESLGS